MAYSIENKGMELDDKAKTEKIEAIEDEVNVLHPLLSRIFSRLSNVSYVEYTHGPNEMGADFVIERVDLELESRHYVGVVVKIGKILQNFTDVERQIDECSTPRLIRQGKETARLPEVWVVTSKTISQNAKQKISEKYNSRTIHFFDSGWLMKRVDQYAPYFWDEVSSSVGAYLSGLDKRLAILNNQAVIPSISSNPAHIELDIQESPSEKYTKQNKQRKPKLVKIVDEILQNKITLLEAEMGFGKSHLARKIASHFSEVSNYRQAKLIPIFSSFKKYLDSKIADLKEFAKRELGEDCFRDAEKDGICFLLILDGVDEASLNFEDYREHLENAVEDARSKSDVKLLLTSRPVKAFDDITAIASSAKRYRIRQLSIAKIINYLKDVLDSKNLPGKLFDDLGKSELFRQLPQNPIAAALLANLLAQDRYELPSNLTELYAKSIELMMGRWDEKRGISTEKMYKVSERLARHLARHMLDNQLVYISRTEIRQMFSAFLADRNVGVPLDEVFDYLINRSNIFGVLGESDAIFFRHRSFAEYLYALDAFQTRDFQINERAFQPYWSNTFFFYVGSLGECPEVLDRLVSLSPTDESARFLRIINLGNLLLAGYQTPYSIIQDSLDVIFVDAARLFLDIREGRAMSRLNGLSEMQLLWLIAMTLRYCYGYAFFEKGLPYAMAKIDDSMLENEETKAYAQFFVASALGELKNNCGYEFLMKKNPSALPLPINLAIQAEMLYADKSFAGNPVVKKFEKKLKNLLYTDVEGRRAKESKMDSLFKEPLGQKMKPKQLAAAATTTKATPFLGK